MYLQSRASAFEGGKIDLYSAHTTFCSGAAIFLRAYPGNSIVKLKLSLAAFLIDLVVSTQMQCSPGYRRSLMKPFHRRKGLYWHQV
jgi:hypothetical protein